MKARLIKHIAKLRDQRILLIKQIEIEEQLIKQKQELLKEKKYKLEKIEQFFDTLI